MKRSGFKRPEIIRTKSVPVRMAQSRGVLAPVDDVVRAVPKPAGVKAEKLGKVAPTAGEARWMAAIAQLGCIACRLDGVAPRPTAVHHILKGGRRLGHLFTLPLCDPGHHQNGAACGFISRHPFKARFEARYGAEMELLEKVRSLVKVAPT